MPNLPPIEIGPYSDQERALIASYLLHQRAGTIAALRSVQAGLPHDTLGWSEGGSQYYTHAEAYSRFLLYWIGYPVAKNQMYTGG